MIPTVDTAAARVTTLAAQVLARLGSEARGACCTITFDVYAPAARVCEARWTRVYATGIASGERVIERASVEECLRQILNHEDEADRLEPQHAGPPPGGGA